VARRAGGGCWAVVRSFVHPSPPSPPLPPLPSLPSPSSRCGAVTCPLAPDPPCEQMLAVVGCGCWVVFPLAPPPRFLSSFHPRSTPRAVARGAGGGWYVVVVVIPLRWRWRRSTHDPPHEQLLVGLEVGGVSFVALRWCWRSLVRRPTLALASFHPRSTPRAVAHGAGGGWCFGVVWAVSHWFPSLVVA
jgi:hypothetical protein